MLLLLLLLELLELLLPDAPLSPAPAAAASLAAFFFAFLAFSATRFAWALFLFFPNETLNVGFSMAPFDSFRFDSLGLMPASSSLGSHHRRVL